MADTFSCCVSGIYCNPANTTCTNCKKVFESRKRMLCHARCAHGWSSLVPSVSCDRCGNTCSSFSTMVELIMHHESEHGFVADCVQLTFQSENEFLLWKKKEEEEGGVSYICNLKKVEGASGASMQSYRCYQHKGEDKRGLPASHRQCNSSGQHCLSVMLKVIKADGIKVTYQKNHYHHEGRHPTSRKPVTGQPPLASPDEAVSSVVDPGGPCSERRSWLLVKEESMFYAQDILDTLLLGDVSDDAVRAVLPILTNICDILMESQGANQASE